MMNTYEYYEKNWQEYCRLTSNSFPQEEVDQFLAMIPSDKELILELGSGSGNCLRYIYEKGYNVSGSDFVIDMVLQLKKRVPCINYVIDFSDVEFLNSFFENTPVKHIFANAALHHLTASELIEFLNLIEVEGLIYLSLKEGVGEVSHEEGRFETYYTQRQIEKLLNKRFEILHFSRKSDLKGRDFNWLSWILTLKK